MHDVLQHPNCAWSERRHFHRITYDHYAATYTQVYRYSEYDIIEIYRIMLGLYYVSDIL